MEEKEKKKQIAKISVFITSIFVIFLSVTYAFINMTVAGTKRQVITSGNLAIELAEEKELTITNAMPMYDEVGMLQDAFNFKLMNKIDAPAEYKLKMIDITKASSNQLDLQMIKYGLVKDSEDPTIGLVTALENNVIDSGVIKGNQTINYKLRLWIKSDVTAEDDIKDKTRSFRIDVEATQSAEETPTGNAVEVITALYKDGQNPSIAKYEQAAVGNQNYAATEYRYVGATPDNYVTFNDETWRIIGSFTVEDGKGNTEQRLKLIRAESIGEYSYDTSLDTKDGGYNGGYGAATWNHAKLNTLLNEGAYWNRTTGTCYNEQYMATTPCDFTATGLSSNAKKMIDDTVLYLGAIPKEIPEYKAADVYAKERQNPNKVCNSTSDSVYCNDTIERIPSWAGKVSIMYASDYGYAVDSTCTSTMENYQSCRDQNWLVVNEKSERYLTNREDSFLGSYVTPYSKGLLYIAVSSPQEIRPTVYLKSNVEIAGGKGSKEEPFQLALTESKTYASYNVGDEITLKDRTVWNVIKSSSTTEEEVTLLSKYNYNTETGIQDKTCGMNVNSDYYCNGIAFDEDATHEYNVSDSNNIGYVVDRTIQPVTGTALGIHRTLAKMRLITYEEIADILGLSKTPTSQSLADNTSPNKEWLLNTNFWTSTGFKTTSEDFGDQGFAYAINVEEIFLAESATDDSFDFGIRPVITIDKAYIK